MNSNNILLGQFDYTDPPNQELPITPLLYSGRYKCESCQCRFVHDYQLWFHWRDHIPRHQRDYSYITSYIAFKRGPERRKMDVSKTDKSKNGMTFFRCVKK